MAKLTKEEIITTLKEMTMLEVADLVKAIETEFGVSAAAQVAVAGAAGAAANDAPTTQTVVLANAGANKVAIIKLFREATGLGLMEAKAAVEKAPVNIKEDLKPEEAAELKKKFEEAGAKIELK